MYSSFYPSNNSTPFTIVLFNFVSVAISIKKPRIEKWWRALVCEGISSMDWRLDLSSDVTLDPIVFTPRFASASISSAQLWNLQKCFDQTEEEVTFKFLWRQQIDHCRFKVCLELGNASSQHFSYDAANLFSFYRDAFKNAKWISRNDRINIKNICKHLKGLYAR